MWYGNFTSEITCYQSDVIPFRCLMEGCIYSRRRKNNDVGLGCKISHPPTLRVAFLTSLPRYETFTPKIYKGIEFVISHVTREIPAWLTMCSMALKLAMQFHNLFNFSNTDCLIPFYSNLCKFHSKLNNLPATNIKCKMRKYESSFPEFLLMILSMSNSTKEKETSVRGR